MRFPIRTCSAWLMAVSLLVVGCSEDATKPEPQHPRSTKTGLITYFAEAHDEEDIEAYEECLHLGYEFWFSEDDRDDPDWDWWDWIDKVEDVRITNNMFSDSNTTHITLSLTNITQIEGAETLEDQYWELTVPGEPPMTVYWAEFLVDMHVVEDAEETIDHWVDGRAYIYIAPDPADTTLWTIWRIEDKGNVHLKATDESSWTEIKRLYRK